MSGLKYEKTPTPKRKKSHKKSILQEKDGTCYLCAKLNFDYSKKSCLHEHHIFGGANRVHSEAEGLKVYLCIEHHEYGKEAVHLNHEMMRLLQEDGQRAFERTHTRQQFMEIFGKNYLPENAGEREKSQSPAILEQEKKAQEGFRFIEPVDFQKI